MLSKNQVKLITSLSQKKHRDETGLFVAEGTKLVLEIAHFFQIRLLVATAGWASQFESQVQSPISIVTQDELSKISGQKTPQGVLAVFEKNETAFSIPEVANSLSLALDDVQDPGNLGTIIRIADWFGIRNIFCSLHCADVFGPKTVQATMGALARVRVHYVDLEAFFTQLPQPFPIYGTFMDGTNIYSETLTSHGIILMGNEGNGISEKTGKLVSNRLLIPNFPLGEPTSESLNVGVATAIVCAEFRRRL